MKKLWTIVTVVALALPVSVMAKSSGKPDVGDALQQWVDAVEAGDVEKTVALYDKNAIFFSTFATSPLKTQDERRAYFKTVLANEEIAVDIIEEHPRVYGDMAVTSGLYDLSYVEEGEEITIHSRFTFTYILRGGRWVIVDHHSSKMPGSN